jgi:hypothetical protein
MRNLKSKVALFLLFLMFIGLNSCALKPIMAEKEYLNIPNEPYVNMDNLGNGKVLFYNYGYYSPAITNGRATKVNIKANGISLGQINYGEFFVVNLEYGESTFETVRKDVFNFKATYKVMIDKNTKVIKICGNTLHKSLKVGSSFPYSRSEVRNLKQ